MEKSHNSLEVFRQLSESITPSTREVLKFENSQAFNRVLDSISSISSSHSFDSLSKALEDISRSYQVPKLPDSISQKSFYDLLEKQLSAYAFSKFSGTSAFLKSIESAMVNTDYDSYVNTVSEVLRKSAISTVDFNFLKYVDVSKSLGNEISIPSGLASSINDINVGASNRIAKTKDIVYDVESACFVASDNSNITATAKEMNVISSGAELFDYMEPEIFDEIELMNFMTLLQNTPTFAAEDQVGRKIQQLIEHTVEHTDFDCDFYYHSRPQEDGACPFTFHEMLTAPSGVTGPGRYNYPGQAFYYFANTIDGSTAEVKKHNNGKNVQTVQIRPNKSINMIDLSGSLKCGQTFLKYIRFPAGDEQIPKAYLIPCFVSDCCRRCGIDGIKYYGTKEYSNYVSWNAGYFEFVTMV